MVQVITGSKCKLIHVRRAGKKKTPYSSFSSFSSSGGGSYYAVCEEVEDISNMKDLCRFDHLPGDCDEPDIVIRRARRELGRFNYNLLTNNCEHFARYCKTGRRESYQVKDRLPVPH